jgi:uncharacterized membrane protein
VVLRLRAERAAALELRLADRITGLAGSMPFVYVHALVFATWMLVFERSPWPMLTLVVSLEAIFLSCFVMIGQDRQAAFQQAKADHDFAEEEQELKLDTELTREIHQLIQEIRGRLVSGEGAPGEAKTTPGAAAHRASPIPRSKKEWVARLRDSRHRAPWTTRRRSRPTDRSAGSCFSPVSGSIEGCARPRSTTSRPCAVHHRRRGRRRRREDACARDRTWANTIIGARRRSPARRF